MECYICMKEWVTIVDTCGFQSHGVCAGCRDQICICPICRVEISPGNEMDDFSDYSEHLPDAETYYA